MHAAEYWFTVLFLIGLGGAAFWFVWNRWRRARLIDDVPTARIRSAPQGYTELHGRAVFSGFNIASPLSGSRCLWYRFKIEKRTRSAKGRRGWRTLHSGTSDTPFLLLDDTDRCLIDPRGAEVTCSRKRIWYGDREWPADGPRASKPATLLDMTLAARRYRYTEELLQEGNVYALGWFKTVTGAQHSLNGRVRELLRTWKSDQADLLTRFDRNGDGHVDAQEWERARDAALQQVLQEQLDHRAEAPLHTLSAPDDERYPYLLSDHAPVNLAQRYRRQAALSVVVFMASSLLVLWLLG